MAASKEDFEMWEGWVHSRMRLLIKASPQQKVALREVAWAGTCPWTVDLRGRGQPGGHARWQ